MCEPEDDATMTYFARYPEELVDEAPTTSASVFGSFFNRIFRPSRDVSPLTNNVEAPLSASQENSGNSEQSTVEEARLQSTSRGI